MILKEEMRLCIPCEIKLVTEGRLVTMIGRNKEKFTCEGCGLRRYGATFRIEDTKTKLPEDPAKEKRKKVTK